MLPLVRYAVALLSSLKFAVWIAVVLAVACITGTILPQADEPQKYVDMVGATAAVWVHRLGFDDVFHTAWFSSLMVLFNMSLVVCTGRKFVQGFPWAYSFARVAADERARRGRMWGNWIFHVSLVAICLGGLAGSVFGWKDFLQVPEGSIVPIPKTSWSVRCDEFTVDFYPGGEKPKLFASELTLVDGAGPLASNRIEVNSPWLIEGVRIYQASWGEEPEFSLTIRDVKTKRSTDARLRLGSVAAVSPSLTVRAEEYLPDFRVQGAGEGQKLVSVSDRPNNPALRLSVFEGGRHVFDDWIFRHAELQEHSGQHRERLRYSWGAIASTQWTGLQVVKDPGFKLVYAGVGGLMLGLLLMFYVFPRRIVRQA